MLQHGSSSSSATTTAAASSSTMGQASSSGSSSNSNRQHRNDRNDRSVAAERPFPCGAAQRPAGGATNGPITSKSGSTIIGLPNLSSLRSQSLGSQSSQQQQQSRHGSSASSSSMPNKSDQRHMTKEHKSHSDKNFVMKHPLSKSAVTQQHYNSSR